MKNNIIKWILKHLRNLLPSPQKQTAPKPLLETQDLSNKEGNKTTFRSDGSKEEALPVINKHYRRPSFETKSSEELCEIKEGMTTEQISLHLASLYQRYNAGTTNMDPRLREDAEKMLGLIVEMRYKYLRPYQ